jgi:hypothetical protein
MRNLKTLLVLLSFFNLALIAQQKKAQTKKVVISTAEISKEKSISGKVMQTSSYCGGAEMPPEMLEEYSKPYPYNGKVFYIRKGKINSTKAAVVLSFTVNALGKFLYQLPPGIYSIIQESQFKALNLKDYQNNGFTKEDADCLKKWWLKPYYILEVKDKDISNLHFEFHHPCFVSGDIPCVQYDGPMPP